MVSSRSHRRAVPTSKRIYVQAFSSEAVFQQPVRRSKCPRGQFSRSRIGPTESIEQIPTKIRDLPILHDCSPLLKFFSVRLPECCALLKVLNYCFALTLLEQFFRQHHVWAKA